jgi:hypothetical protein
VDNRSNEELARLIHRKTGTDEPQRRSEPQHSMRVVPKGVPAGLGAQQWSLGRQQPGVAELSEREVRALFTALSKGTRSRLGRDATFKELLLLKEQINAARNLVRRAEEAIQGGSSVHFDQGQPVFEKPATRGSGDRVA